MAQYSTVYWQLESKNADINENRHDGTNTERRWLMNENHAGANVNTEFFFDQKAACYSPRTANKRKRERCRKIS